MFKSGDQQAYQRYADAHDAGDYSGIDPDQATSHVQQFMETAPPEMQQQVYRQHFEQMPQDQREQFAQQMPSAYNVNPNNPQTMAQGFHQMGQQQPSLVGQLLGSLGGGGMSGGLGSLIGLVAKTVMSNRGGML